MSYACIDDSIRDYPESEKALWEAAVAAGISCVATHTPSTPTTMNAEREMLRRGAAPGTGFGYFGRSTTIRVFYRALDGTYWDIVYRGPNWQIAGVEPWHTELAAIGMESRPPVVPGTSV
jgi:hypothetical protein